jgi:nucleoside-diphosphate-sugar epimerase
MQSILLTGATGFLGSHIAEELIALGFQVIVLKRSTSNLKYCNGFADQISWIDCDDLTFAQQEIIRLKPTVLIHAAWSGVKSHDRDRWSEQEKNISFLVSILELAKKVGIKKIIALGSQAEYGSFENIVNESYSCNPNSAYGAIKLCSSVILKAFAEQNNIDWYWIRIFSVFGPREDANWLIPSAIINLLNKKEMALTPCEQRYDYLYIKDFTSGILSIVKKDKDKSGIYNMSSGSNIMIKEILSFLEHRLSPKQKILKFGELAYRPNQVMNMQGNSDLFFQTFNFKPKFNVYDGLEVTINYYLNQRNHE